MTIEELKKEVAEATEDVLKGNGVKHDDFMKEGNTTVILKYNQNESIKTISSLFSGFVILFGNHVLYKRAGYI